MFIRRWLAKRLDYAAVTTKVRPLWGLFVFNLEVDRTLEPSVTTFVCVVCLGMADIPEIPDILDFFEEYGFYSS